MMKIINKLKRGFTCLYHESNLIKFFDLRANFGFCIAFKSVIYKTILFITNGKVNYYNNLIKRELAKRFSYIIDDLAINDDQSTFEEKNRIPVWCLWWQGYEAAPEIIKSCIISQRHNLNSSSYEFHLLDRNTYNNFCEFDTDLMKKFEDGKISITHLSDLIRMRLLSHFGGVWMDATLYISNDFTDILKNYSFYTNKKFTYKENLRKLVPKGRWTAYFIKGEKNNLLFQYLDKAFTEYWNKYSCLLDYYLIDYFICIAYEQFIEVKEMIDNVPINNEQIFKLVSILNSKYDDNIYNELCKTNQIHKLSYQFEYYHSTNNGEKTFYHQLINNKFDESEDSYENWNFNIS